MDKKICMITGANSGIGKAAATQIARQGYHTILACRNPERGKTALREIEKDSHSASLELMIVDMSLQSSIRGLSKNFFHKYDRLDVLIHNAAIFDVTQKDVVYTSEGIEAVWATNHLGPSLLTKLLLDAIKNSEQGRIITIASKGLKAKPFLKVDLEDPEFRKKKFSIIDAYYQSKRAQVMYTYWLAEELKDTSITANCIQVPAVQVDISKYSKLPSIMRFLYSLKSKFALSPEEMAETYTYLTTSDEMRSVTGKYFDEKRRIVKSNKYTYQTENIEKIMILTMSYLKQDRGSK
jgi:NAD(P)-dependent dehydrogenase (short-subunit alcohol dehydrogenase family)